MGESYTGVPALERAGQVLRLVLNAPVGLKASELYRCCRFPKASFYRLLQAMEKEGYLQYRPESGRYLAGPLFERAYRSRDEQHGLLRQAAQPVLERLAELSKETAKLNIISGGACYVLATAPGPQRIRITVDEGAAYPLHTGAAGKLLLAYAGDEAIRAYFGGKAAARYTPQTVTDEARFLQLAKGIRQQGFALDTGEFIEQIGAAACPVRLADGRVAAAISIAYPNVLFHEVQIERLVKLLRQETARLEEKLRLQGPAGTQKTGRE